MQNTTHTARTDDAPKPAAAEPERLPAVMPWEPAYYREEDATRRTQNSACARCHTVAELVWSAGELLCIGCLLWVSTCFTWPSQPRSSADPAACEPSSLRISCSSSS